MSTPAYGEPFAVTGATGPSPEPEMRLRNGQWYAFRLDGRDFYAVTILDRPFARIRLTEIPDPWICKECGRSYREGSHVEVGVENGHRYVARGYNPTSRLRDVE